MASTVFHIEGGIGKNIAATAVVAAYKKAKPKRKIIVVSAWPEVWNLNPDVARFYRIGNTPYFYQDVIKGKDVEVYAQDPYKQTSHITKKAHLIDTWCKMVGVKNNSEKPKLEFNFREVEEGGAYVNQFNETNKPVLIFQPFGGPGPEHQQHPYSWTRDMHPHQAQELVDKLADKYNIIHVCYEFHPRLNNCHRFDKIVGKKALFAMLAHSEKRVLIDSSLQHAANALDLPSTVLWVSTEPTLFGYDTHDNHNTKVQYKNGTIDSYLFDYQFTGLIHECPFKSKDYELHDIDTVVKSVLT
tara:strand:- start:2966 stop:3865 length:900 start_codon:yes stop_codon:yes gene_type:complete